MDSRPLPVIHVQCDQAILDVQKASRGLLSKGRVVKASFVAEWSESSWHGVLYLTNGREWRLDQSLRRYLSQLARDGLFEVRLPIPHLDFLHTRHRSMISMLSYDLSL